MTGGVQIISLEEVIAKRNGSVDPAKFAEEYFELLSIPAFDVGKPEITIGAEIGSTKQVVQEGDVLLSKIVPHIRRAWVVKPTTNHRLIASGEWIVFRDSRFDPNYLRHLLTADGFHRQFMQTVSGVGGSLMRARPAEVAKIKVLLPPKIEQQRIAIILDKADSLRRKRQEAISLASELVRSKFSEMFGEPHTNINNLPKTSLGDLVRLRSGNFLPSHEMAGTGGIFVYGGNGVNGEHDTAMFDEVKLVIGRVGAYCGAVHLTKPHSWITDNALYVSEISPLVRLEYLAFALTQANLNQYSSQSGQPLVSASRLYPVMLVLPPLSLQDAFLEVLDCTNRIKASQTNSLEALEEMSRSLAAELFAQG